jgi:hypothetical protein
MSEWELTSSFLCVCVSENSPPNFSVCVWVWAHLPISVCEWVRTHLLIWVCVCVRENSPPHLCLWVRERTHLPFALPSNHTSDNLLANRVLDERTDIQTDGHIRFSAEILNPKPGHTQEDTHYTEWYPLRTHPRRYPLHWVIPIPWVIFLSLTVLTTHPRVYPLH